MFSDICKKINNKKGDEEKINKYILNELNKKDNN